MILASKVPGVRRVLGPLIAMVVLTALHSCFKFYGVATIGSAFGGIPQGLPSIGLPEITLPQIIELIGPAFAIAMLGAIGSLLSAAVADGMAGTKHDSNQELIGQGIASLVTPLLGGFAATGAIARTATNIRNGGNSPIAGFAHAVTLITLLEVIEQLRKRSIVVKLCEANEKVLGKLDKAGVLQALGSQHYHADFSGALGSYSEPQG